MPVHPVVDTYPLVYDPADPTKQVRLDSGQVGAGQTRVLSMPDQDVDLGDILGLDAAKGFIARDRLGVFVTRRVVAGSRKVYVSEGDGETGDTHIDVVPGNIAHADLAGLQTDPNPHGADLSDLDDVNAAAPSEGQVLTWDNPAGEWQNKAANPHNHSTSDISSGTLVHERGGIEADISAIAKGGLLVGTATGAMGIKTVGTDNKILVAQASQAGGLMWIDMPDRYRDRAGAFTLEDAVGGRFYKLGKIPAAGVLQRINHFTFGGTSVTFHLYINAESGVDDSGTDVFASAQTANSTPTVTTSFTSNAMSQYNTLWLEIVTVTGSVSKLYLDWIMRVNLA